MPDEVTQPWEELGVRPETADAWRTLGLDAFESALAQSDGYGPASARHYVSQLRSVASTWRKAGLDEAEALRWHRAGFRAEEAARWRARGTDVDAAALAAGRRMRG